MYAAVRAVCDSEEHARWRKLTEYAGTSHGRLHVMFSATLSRPGPLAARGWYSGKRPARRARARSVIRGQGGSCSQSASLASRFGGRSREGWPRLLPDRRIRRFRDCMHARRVMRLMMRATAVVLTQTKLKCQQVAAPRRRSSAGPLAGAGGGDLTEEGRGGRAAAHIHSIACRCRCTVACTRRPGCEWPKCPEAKFRKQPRVHCMPSPVRLSDGV